MNNLTINPRFRDLLPPLTPSELEQLEKSVLEEGIRDAIKVWNNQIIDGHNRYELAQNYDLPFKTIEVVFDNEDDVCEWMLTNQLGRRNLEPNIKTLLIGQLYELQKKRRGGDRKSEDFQEENQTDTVAVTVKTAEKIAQNFNVSPRTVERAAKVAQAFEKAPEPVKKQFQQGTISQKKLVETVTPKPQPKPTINEILDDDRFDENTRLCKDFGNRFQKIIREFESLQSEMSLAFGRNGFPLDKFARNLITTNLKGQNTEAYFLKKIVKCPNCKGKGCQSCGKGYVSTDDEASIIDRNEYLAKGGITFDAYMEAKNA